MCLLGFEDVLLPGVQLNRKHTLVVPNGMARVRHSGVDVPVAQRLTVSAADLLALHHDFAWQHKICGQRLRAGGNDALIVRTLLVRQRLARRASFGQQGLHAGRSVHAHAVHDLANPPRGNALQRGVVGVHRVFRVVDKGVDVLLQLPAG